MANNDKTEEKTSDLDDELSEKAQDDEGILKTHERIRMHLCGSIVDLKKGYAKVTLPCSKDMSVDNLGLIHGGFIFGAADFAAMAAVNEPTVVLIGSKTRFLAPAKIGDVVEFEAKAKFEDARKRDVEVIGKINDIKVFEGTFYTVVLEKHVLKLKLPKQ
jgi:acyl-CoA thioesterase